LRALATREALLQAIGADAETRIQLPDRLPDLPQQAISTDQLHGAERPQRLDVRLAQERWQAARLQAGLSRVESIADIGFQAKRGSSQAGKWILHCLCGTVAHCSARLHKPAWKQHVSRHWQSPCRQHRNSA
jgi:hypothetical protein